MGEYRKSMYGIALTWIEDGYEKVWLESQLYDNLADVIETIHKIYNTNPERTDLEIIEIKEMKTDEAKASDYILNDLNLGFRKVYGLIIIKGEFKKLIVNGYDITMGKMKKGWIFPFILVSPEHSITIDAKNVLVGIVGW